VNGRGDPDDTGYASLAVAPVALPPLEAAMSLARYLDTDLASAGGMLMRGNAAPAIQRRQRQLEEEQRAGGHVACRKCGGQVRPSQLCACGEQAPGSTLDGRAALRALERKFVAPL
jgi:hypothetical protein